MTGENWFKEILRRKHRFYRVRTVSRRLLPTVTFANPASQDEWIKFNNNQTGFYRVNYPGNLWQKLADQLETDHLVSERSSSLVLIGQRTNVGLPVLWFHYTIPPYAGAYIGMCCVL